ncbi:host attachment protein [Prosthecomicrobium sp. N25]|uniref:host attachment protein n=1 Tax=Prosthecomicrobium sp. N25 TaxID=3129254 RepID=UPI003077D7BC
MKAKKTWIVAADGARARLFAREGNTFVQVHDGVFEGGRDLAHDVGSDRPGRTHESSGPMRHSVEPKIDYRDKVEAAFLDGVIARLEAERRAGNLDRLVLVAAPEALGHLRRAMPEPLAETVVGTIPKDLTHAPLEQVVDTVTAAVPL